MAGRDSESRSPGGVLRSGLQVVPRNLIAGACALVLASVGGFVLGITYDPYFADGFYKATMERALVKAAHTHGQPFGLMNLILGLLIPHLALSDRQKDVLSWSGVVALLMPVGLLLRGLDGASMRAAPFSFVGGTAFLVAAALVLRGAWRLCGR